ncbi:5-formyltetrahydrofolate cyclo-ligase [Duganella ginsengisoli]|uniref:5-formyltetrahydrofolate cyclo-ligase n=1 Tax=Pseudoduganella ginsengisoli TaxID=1462440 RepID=A0A6L6Q1P6_9BURK|nr:5-formyltetrahydrofolate cyclo-ligase [Pseudoduganella ginsengisoli]
MTSDPRIPRNPATPPDKLPLGKAELRKQLLAARRALAPETRAAWDQALCAKVLAWQAENKIQELGVYWPLRDEPDLRPAYDELARRGVRLLLPVVVAKHTALEFAEWTIGEAMVKDTMGVAVPAGLRMTDYPPALLVPCLGYNPHRFRLGYGGGFYDRTLEHTPRPATAGIAYSCLQADFPDDPHDVALDVMLTEAD